jgi:hypothetical protein
MSHPLFWGGYARNPLVRGCLTSHPLCWGWPCEHPFHWGRLREPAFPLGVAREPSHQLGVATQATTIAGVAGTPCRGGGAALPSLAICFCFGFWYFYNKINVCFHMWHVMWQNCLRGINPSRGGHPSPPLEMVVRSPLSNI